MKIPLRAARAIFAACVLLGIVLLPGQLAWSAQQCLKWRVLSANTNGAFGQATVTLNAIAAISARNVWAVGSSFTGNLAPLVEHWDGRTWHILPDLYGNELLGLAGRSATDMWAVGDDGTDQGLIIHWNGKRWTYPYSPIAQGKNSTGAKLTAVAAISANDAWAVGEIDSAPMIPLVEHWDGKAWHIVRPPSFQGALYSVVALSARDVWVAGADVRFNHPVLAHWDGRRWTLARIPLGSFDQGARSGVSPALRGMVAISSRDIWAVGGYNGDCAVIVNCTLASSSPFIFHWNGRQWSYMPVANMGGSLTAAAASAGNDVWISGTTAIYHWDGRAWMVSARQADFSTIAVLNPVDVWAGGPELYVYPSDSPMLPRIEHYNVGAC